MSQLSQERSNLVHAARQVINELLGPGFEQKTFRSNFPDRGSDPRLQALLQNPMKPTEKYPLDAPMLFPGSNCADIGHIFEVEPLFRVSARIFLPHIMYADCVSVSSVYFGRKIVHGR